MPPFHTTGRQSAYGKNHSVDKYIQHSHAAFLPGRDTTLQQLCFTEYVTDNFNEREYTVTIFLEVSKIYDTVCTTGLIYVYKIHKAGIPDFSLLLLASYLTDYKFRVKME
jgi:hypothetical protein